MNNDSECQMKKVMALISKWKCDSELQDEDVALKSKMKMNNGFECQTEDATLNTKRKTNNGSERQTEDVSRYLNECVALNSERKMNDGSEYQNEKCDDIELKAYDGSERRTERMAMNIKLKVIAMNAKQKQRL